MLGYHDLHLHFEVITEKLTWQHEGIHTLSAPNSPSAGHWHLCKIYSTHVLVLSPITDLSLDSLEDRNCNKLPKACISWCAHSIFALQMIKKEWRVVIDNWACEVVHLMCTVEVLCIAIRPVFVIVLTLRLGWYLCNKSEFHCTC